MDECSSMSSTGHDGKVQTPTCFRRVSRRIWTSLFRIHRNDPPPPKTSIRSKLPSCLNFNIPTVKNIQLLNEDECIFDFVALVTPSHSRRKHTTDDHRPVDSSMVNASLFRPDPSVRCHQIRVLLHHPTEPETVQLHRSACELPVTEVQDPSTPPPAQLHHINPSSSERRAVVKQSGSDGADGWSLIFSEPRPLTTFSDPDPSQRDKQRNKGIGIERFEVFDIPDTSPPYTEQDVGIKVDDCSRFNVFAPPLGYKSSSFYSPSPPLHHINPSAGPGLSPGDKHAFHCVSVPSLIENQRVKETARRALSLPPMVLNSSFKEFTPEVTVGEMDEAYRFQSSGPGLYHCSVTGLVFGMETEGVVVYGTVPWNHRMLDQYHKKPAGPLFDITCVDKSVVQLHLPHCELRPTGGWDFLSVAHVGDDGSIEFIRPQKITETHVVISITSFSPVGNVKDKESPPDPVRALVLLFLRPSADPDLQSLLNVLLLPNNVLLRDVLRTRKVLVGDEIYIETSPHCKLQPKQVYTLTTSPEDSGKVQPKEAEFFEDSYGNYFPAFQVILTKIITNLNLLLTDKSTSCCVWEREVCLSSTRVRGSPVLDQPLGQRLVDIRSSFIDGISGPCLKSLLDKLLEKGVINDAEMEEVDGIQTRGNKARFVIDTVRKKGEDNSAAMIKSLWELDPCLCSSIGLKLN